MTNQVFDVRGVGLTNLLEGGTLTSGDETVWENVPKVGDTFTFKAEKARGVVKADSVEALGEAGKYCVTCRLDRITWVDPAIMEEFAQKYPNHLPSK